MDLAFADPHGALRDPEMPFLSDALDPAAVGPRFTRRFRHLAGGGEIRVLAARVVRHKKGRRCLIEYDLGVERSGFPPEKFTLLGKVRAKGTDRSGFLLLRELWMSGFGGRSEDGVCVPEPVGVVPEFRMWVQKKAPGVPATGLLAQPGGVALAGRIAEAIHKLHGAGPVPQRRHSMAEELRILRERLTSVAVANPQWAGRLTRVLSASDRLAASVAEPAPCGIHRDFYADQVLVDGDRIFLLDFDLFCEGDPALDIGNFSAHLTEQALRTLGDPDALSDREEALTEKFLRLSGEHHRASVHAYASLTLARHVWISTQIPERNPFTEPLLDLVEHRLA